MPDLKKDMHARIDARLKFLQDKADKVHRLIDRGIIGGEEGRLWLDQFAHGIGYNIGCGDFLLGDAAGVDGQKNMLASDLFMDWEEVPMQEGQADFIVTNYLEVFPNPLRILEDWVTRLKQGGVVAIVARNAEAYAGESKGPLANKRRRSCFTASTLKCYLEAAGFVVFREEKWEKELRIAARKV
jgi:SAM-dependent methyltransferase